MYSARPPKVPGRGRPIIEMVYRIDYLDVNDPLDKLYLPPPTCRILYEGSIIAQLNVANTHLRPHRRSLLFLPVVAQGEEINVPRHIQLKQQTRGRFSRTGVKIPTGGLQMGQEIKWLRDILERIRVSLMPLPCGGMLLDTL